MVLEPRTGRATAMRPTTTRTASLNLKTATTPTTGAPGDCGGDRRRRHRQRATSTEMCYADLDEDGYAFHAVPPEPPVASTDADCDDEGEAGRCAQTDCDSTALARPGGVEILERHRSRLPWCRPLPRRPRRRRLPLFGRWAPSSRSTWTTRARPRPMRPPLTAMTWSGISQMRSVQPTAGRGLQRRRGSATSTPRRRRLREPGAVSSRRTWTVSTPRQRRAGGRLQRPRRHGEDPSAQDIVLDGIDQNCDGGDELLRGRRRRRHTGHGRHHRGVGRLRLRVPARPTKPHRPPTATTPTRASVHLPASSP